MSILSLIDDINPKNMVYTLQHKEPTTTIGDSGSFGEEWVDIQIIHGFLHQPDEKLMDTDGATTIGNHIGMFEPDFEIDSEALRTYRIKRTLGQFIRYYKIVRFNDNLVIDGEIDHYEFELKKDTNA